MTIVEFIRARVLEDPHMTAVMERALLSILDWHENWPVLCETKPEFTQMDDFDHVNIQYQMTRQIQWLTERQYVEKFGSAPPSAPIMKILATAWSHHDDFEEEWLAS